MNIIGGQTGIDSQKVMWDISFTFGWRIRNVLTTKPLGNWVAHRTSIPCCCKPLWKNPQFHDLIGDNDRRAGRSLCESAVGCAVLDRLGGEGAAE